MEKEFNEILETVFDEKSTVSSISDQKIREVLRRAKLKFIHQWDLNEIWEKYANMMKIFNKIT